MLILEDAVYSCIHTFGMPHCAQTYIKVSASCAYLSFKDINCMSLLQLSSLSGSICGRSGVKKKPEIPTGSSAGWPKSVREVRVSLMLLMLLLLLRMNTLLINSTDESSIHTHIYCTKTISPISVISPAVTVMPVSVTGTYPSAVISMS